jgi:hypothetical protein
MPSIQNGSGHVIIRRAAVVVVLTLASIAVHESGHYVVYALAGCPVVVTLQSVHPVGPVADTLDHWAKLAGPAFSFLAAAVCLAVAHRRRSFAWATAALTNASLRLFPLAMDVLRAIKRAPAFSDEGEVALALTAASSRRLWLLAVPIALSILLTGLAAREYHFERRGGLKVGAIYLLSLAVGIGVVVVDELVR